MPRKTDAQLNREINQILAKPRAKRSSPSRPTGDPHQLARRASDEAFRSGSPEAHRQAARALRVSAQAHRKAHNRWLSDYQEPHARMQDGEAQAAKLDCPSTAHIVRAAVERTPRRLGN